METIAIVPDPGPGEGWELTPAEELLLHQLQARQYWAGKGAGSEPEDTGKEGQKATSDVSPAVPLRWSLLGNVTLYDWQRDCIDNWFAAGKRGTVKVVTGAGKTVLALGLMERLQSEHQPDLRVAVVVPTIVLMNQWYDEFIERSNLPRQAIGRLGGGYQDDFGGERRVLLCVLNSAQARLAGLVAQAGHEKRLLLVVDECHRAGATMMSNVFKTKRAFNLGLSATPEREDMADADEDEEATADSDQIRSVEHEYNESFLGQQLGPIIFHMTVEDAFARGILPPYEIRHYGLPLILEERQRYERLTRSIQDTRQELSGIALSRGVSSDGSFNRWCRAVAQKGDELGRLARRYIADVARRKALLYQANARREAVIKLLERELAENPEARAILFHESIEEAMALWRALVARGLPAVPENSQLSNTIRENSLDLFRRGSGQILVSVRSLVEGFNVPATDVGLIVASSTSVRQRIQTIGRVLRKHRTRSGEEKHAVVQVLYIDQTVDDLIYAKTDWGRITGAERNTYYRWDPIAGTSPEEQPGPPRQPLPTDLEVDASTLEPGATYPGAYEGTEYTADTSGNVHPAGNKELFARNPQGVPEKIHNAKGSYGRFRVTPNKQYVLVIVPQGDEWLTRYAGALVEPFEFGSPGAPTKEKPPVVDLAPGDVFAGPVPKDAARFGYKQVRGRDVITQKAGKGEVYARTSQYARELKRGQAAEQLLSNLAAAEQAGGVRITEFVVTEEGQAFHLYKGKWFYIGSVSVPLEFPDIS